MSNKLHKPSEFSFGTRLSFFLSAHRYIEESGDDLGYGIVSGTLIRKSYPHYLIGFRNNDTLPDIHFNITLLISGSIYGCLNGCYVEDYFNCWEEDNSKSIRNIASAVCINTNLMQPEIAINDFICKTCKNDRCSQSEKTCWKCGNLL